MDLWTGALFTYFSRTAYSEVSIIKCRFLYESWYKLWYILGMEKSLKAVVKDYSNFEIWVSVQVYASRHRWEPISKNDWMQFSVHWAFARRSESWDGCIVDASEANGHSEQGSTPHFRICTCRWYVVRESHWSSGKPSWTLYHYSSSLSTIFWIAISIWFPV